MSWAQGGAANTCNQGVNRDSQLGYSEIDKENNECLHGEFLLHDNSVYCWAWGEAVAAHLPCDEAVVTCHEVMMKLNHEAQA